MAIRRASALRVSGLPVLVGNSGSNAWDEPLQWSDVSADPVAAVSAQYNGDLVELPAGVYEAGRAYSAAQFSLSEQANRDLAALCRALGVDADQSPCTSAARRSRRRPSWAPRTTARAAFNR